MAAVLHGWLEEDLCARISAAKAYRVPLERTKPLQLLEFLNFRFERTPDSELINGWVSDSQVKIPCTFTRECEKKVMGETGMRFTQLRAAIIHNIKGHVEIFLEAGKDQARRAKARLLISSFSVFSGIGEQLFGVPKDFNVLVPAREVLNTRKVGSLLQSQVASPAQADEDEEIRSQANESDDSLDIGDASPQPFTQAPAAMLKKLPSGLANIAVKPAVPATTYPPAIAAMATQSVKKTESPTPALATPAAIQPSPAVTSLRRALQAEAAQKTPAKAVRMDLNGQSAPPIKLGTSQEVPIGKAKDLSSLQRPDSELNTVAPSTPLVAPIAAKAAPPASAIAAKLSSSQATPLQKMEPQFTQVALAAPAKVEARTKSPPPPPQSPGVAAQVEELEIPRTSVPSGSQVAEAGEAAEPVAPRVTRVLIHEGWSDFQDLTYYDQTIPVDQVAVLESEDCWRPEGNYKIEAIKHVSKKAKEAAAAKVAADALKQSLEAARKHTAASLKTTEESAQDDGDDVELPASQWELSPSPPPRRGHNSPPPHSSPSEPDSPVASKPDSVAPFIPGRLHGDDTNELTNAAAPASSPIATAVHASYADQDLGVPLGQGGRHIPAPVHSHDDSDEGETYKTRQSFVPLPGSVMETQSLPTQVSYPDDSSSSEDEFLDPAQPKRMQAQLQSVNKDVEPTDITTTQMATHAKIPSGSVPMGRETLSVEAADEPADTTEAIQQVAGVASPVRPEYRPAPSMHTPPSSGQGKSSMPTPPDDGDLSRELASDVQMMDAENPAVLVSEEAKTGDVHKTDSDTIMRDANETATLFATQKATSPLASITSTKSQSSQAQAAGSDVPYTQAPRRLSPVLQSQTPQPAATQLQPQNLRPSSPVKETQRVSTEARTLQTQGEREASTQQSRKASSPSSPTRVRVMMPPAGDRYRAVFASSPVAESTPFESAAVVRTTTNTAVARTDGQQTVVEQQIVTEVEQSSLESGADAGATTQQAHADLVTQPSVEVTVLMDTVMQVQSAPTQEEAEHAEATPRQHVSISNVQETPSWELEERRNLSTSNKSGLPARTQGSAVGKALKPADDISASQVVRHTVLLKDSLQKLRKVAGKANDNGRLTASDLVKQGRQDFKRMQGHLKDTEWAELSDASVDDILAENPSLPAPSSVQRPIVLDSESETDTAARDNVGENSDMDDEEDRLAAASLKGSEKMTRIYDNKIAPSQEQAHSQTSVLTSPGIVTRPSFPLRARKQKRRIEEIASSDSDERIEGPSRKKHAVANAVDDEEMELESLGIDMEAELEEAANLDIPWWLDEETRPTRPNEENTPMRLLLASTFSNKAQAVKKPCSVFDWEWMLEAADERKVATV
ncbi:hypothetical protein BCR37DRAFT_375767 [Protomyces lactucae-debilis]|uniref:Uncharacterized protein n=1 Tax=Protomyces lactucae-debilis TaxID=2754530 RepID=A0A1Y2FWE2_PROLT|nr:uncharacterized protein BCR37DRAFT_375767 [Protomyces lactucae-debilis]ORY87857.1 hypothetical protein BCR37DRAFT_375767 [Protomyces lactucae-debilis]